MKLILAFLIVGSVIAAGCALQCNTCITHEKGADNCENTEVVTCKDDERCAVQYERNILVTENGEIKYVDDQPTIRKRCLAESESLLCGLPMTINSTDEFKVILYTTCCTTDECNTGPIKPPKINTHTNGHVCQVCFKEGENAQCTKYIKKECTGNQLECITFNGMAQRPGDKMKTYAIVACTTYGTCTLNRTSLAGTKIHPDAVYTCTDAKKI